jgi:hypothetical protein
VFDYQADWFAELTRLFKLLTCGISARDANPLEFFNDNTDLPAGVDGIACVGSGPLRCARRTTKWFRARLPFVRKPGRKPGRAQRTRNGA